MTEEQISYLNKQLEIINECNGCEYKCSLSHIDICTLGSPCPHQRSTPMTNEEWFCGLSTKKKAKFFKDISEKCLNCGGAIDYDEIGECPFGRCRTGLNEYEDWLKEKRDMTNEEWLRSISTRELAKNLALLVLYDMPLYDRLHNSFEGGESAVIDACEKWLKEKHE